MIKMQTKQPTARGVAIIPARSGSAALAVLGQTPTYTTDLSNAFDFIRSAAVGTTVNPRTKGTEAWSPPV